MKKKKTRTPRQVKTRFIFAVSLIGAMALFLLIHPKKEIQTVPDTVTPSLDTALTRALRTRFGEGTELLSALPYEEYLEKETMEHYYSNDLANILNQSGLELASDMVKNQAVNDNESPKVYYVRRITILTGEEIPRKITGFQKTRKDFGETSLTNLIEISDSVSRESIVKEIESINNQK